MVAIRTYQFIYHIILTVLKVNLLPHVFYHHILLIQYLLCSIRLTVELCNTSLSLHIQNKLGFHNIDITNDMTYLTHVHINLDIIFYSTWRCKPYIMLFKRFDSKIMIQHISYLVILQIDTYNTKNWSRILPLGITILGSISSITNLNQTSLLL